MFYIQLSTIPKEEFLYINFISLITKFLISPRYLNNSIIYSSLRKREIATALTCFAMTTSLDESSNYNKQSKLCYYNLDKTKEKKRSFLTFNSLRMT